MMTNSLQSTCGSKEMFLNRPAGNLATNGGTVKHPGHAHVVDVARGAGHFIAAFLARYRLADDAFFCHAIVVR